MSSVCSAGAFTTDYIHESLSSQLQRHQLRQLQHGVYLSQSIPISSSPVQSTVDSSSGVTGEVGVSEESSSPCNLSISPIAPQWKKEEYSAEEEGLQSPPDTDATIGKLGNCF